MKNTMPTVERVCALMAAGHRGEAATVAKDHLGRLSIGPEACILDGLALQIEGRSREAVAAFEKALSFAPDALPAYFGIVEIFAEKGWFHSAIVVLENAEKAAHFSEDTGARLKTLRDRLASRTRSTAGA